VPGLATSGSGDVLAGLVAGLLARGAEPAQAAVWAVALHARAGAALARRFGPLGYLARELAAEVPALMERQRPRARR
jgi:NAD(P)H-hydrate repair Nnr-like enzyme with NAD(P)H-hydrate dehydratase domain